MRNLTNTLIFNSIFAIHLAQAAPSPTTGDAALVVTVEPRQADIFVDGELKGNVTPLLIYLPAGQHKVLIQQTGWQSQELEVMLTKDAIASQKITLIPEKPPAPTCDPSQLALTRDPFETDDEFADRGFEVISQLNAGATRQDVACQAGVAKLNKAKYDLKAKIFPLEITWQPWTKELKLEAKGQIAIPKNQARGLWKEGIEKPVFVLFDQLKETPTVDKIVLLGLQQQWEIKTQSIKPPEPERLPFEPEMVAIPAGSFEMGSPSNEQGRSDDEGPVHTVHVKAFQMGKYEVTQGEWQAVMGNNPSYFSSCGDRCPVEQVSWSEVQEYISKLNAKTNKQYRLPTEAEWEYAARAGTSTRFSFGNDDRDLGNYAWFDANSDSKTHPVGEKQPNPWGLYDMHGNVWEWNQDKWHSSYTGAPTDGSAWESGDYNARLLRGCSWYNKPDLCRSAFRNHNDHSNSGHGVRVVAAVSSP